MKRIFLGVSGILFPVVLFIFCFSLVLVLYAQTDDTVGIQQNDEQGKTIGIQEKISSSTDFGVFTGTLLGIDSTNPANVRLQIRDSKDNNVRTVLVSPWTKVTKSTTSEDLKEGDTVRVMIRKAEDKEVAMSVIFGNIDGEY